jgi:hypothetical protein
MNIFVRLANEAGGQRAALQAINAVLGAAYKAPSYNHWYSGRQTAPARVVNACLLLLGVDLVVPEGAQEVS